MKKLLFVVGTSLLRSWLVPQDRPGSFAALPPSPPPRLNFPYLRKLSRRFAMIAGIGYLFLLFFALGTVMAIQAAAQSYDLFGVFVAGAVFYAGVFLSLVSLLVIAACVWAARRPASGREELFLGEASAPSQPHRSEVEVDMMRIVEPFLSGLVAGWTSGRKSPAEKEATLQSREEPNVREFRVG